MATFSTKILSSNVKTDHASIEGHEEDLVPRSLALAVSETLKSIPALREYFGPIPDPLTYRKWKNLPIINRYFYAALGSADKAIKETDAIFQSSPPIHYSRPFFPFAVHQSSRDRSFAQERLQEILTMAPIQRTDSLVLLTGDDELYFAAEFAELAIKSGYPFTIQLGQSLSSEEINLQLRKLQAKFVVWLLPRLPESNELPSSVAALVTFNSVGTASTIRWHADIAHVDPVPFFGFRINASQYEALLNHCFIEVVNGRLVVTTIADQMLPVMRLDTEITGGNIRYLHL